MSEITHLTLCDYFHKFTDLPPTLKSLKFGEHIYWGFFNFPPSLSHLEFGNLYYSYYQNTLPPNLTHLTCKVISLYL